MTNVNDELWHELAKKIVEAITLDLLGRSGFDHWWDGIDDDIRHEIEAKHVRLAQRVLNTYLGRA